MTTVLQPAASHSETSFPIIAIAVVGIILTVTFLLAYYIFVIKCCLNLHGSDIIHLLSRSRRRLHYSSNHNHPLPSFQNQGLHESAIQAIPILKFKANSSFNDCSVCLYEFEEEERIRMLPSCFHAFHIDCIDTWLQTHSNCPLCRGAVSCAALIQNICDEVVIDVREECSENDRKMNKGWSLGDECVDLRGKGEEFGVEPIRRSFSTGSVSDRRLYATVQEILRQNSHFREKLNGEGSSTGSTRKVLKLRDNWGTWACLYWVLLVILFLLLYLPF